jgi:uncharacterized caspase-like protein
MAEVDANTWHTKLASWLAGVLLGLWALLPAQAAHAAAPAGSNLAPKVALLIGNSEYGGNRSLKNPSNDVDLMASTLEKLGFSVQAVRELEKAQFATVIKQFAQSVPKGATALVFFAGHGMQINSASYLIPVDMVPTSEQGVMQRAYPLKSLLDDMAASAAAVNIVVLDACRNNPFQPGKPARYRNFSNLGLAPVQAPRGTLVAYATAPNHLAEDGIDANNGVYSAALAESLLEPNLTLEQAFKRAGDKVRKKTFDDQIPWFESSLTGEYFLIPPTGVNVVAGQPLDRVPAGQPTPASRGQQSGNSTPVAAATSVNQWYQRLTESEWSTLDWEIQQRVKHLTPDELPALEYKAKGGSVVAQTTLGLVYREGTDRAVAVATGRDTRFKANNTLALKWLRAAANAGFAVAQTELGEMYFDGRGVERDLKESRQWLEKAAEARYPRAKLNLLQLRMIDGDIPTNIGQEVLNILRPALQVPAAR